MEPYWTEFKPDRRDELISLARVGEITPERAEAEAAANGWEPFAREPGVAEFDPMLESRWSIVMVVAWIAWRDKELVRKYCSAFRSQCTHWVGPREWNQPIDNGTTFATKKVWFLEFWPEATTSLLAILDKSWRNENALPPTTRMSVPEAEGVLWRALEEAHLVAEALDRTGKPVDIPQREWSYLRLFEDGKRDILKYDALEREPPFTEVKFRRSDVFSLWPPVSAKARD